MASRSLILSDLYYDVRYHVESAAPSAPPASPAAGCIQILSKIFSRNRMPFATQFNATPPARQRLRSPVSWLYLC